MCLFLFYSMQIRKPVSPQLRRLSQKCFYIPEAHSNPKQAISHFCRKFTLSILNFGRNYFSNTSESKHTLTFLPLLLCKSDLYLCFFQNFIANTTIEMLCCYVKYSDFSMNFLFPLYHRYNSENGPSGRWLIEGQYIAFYLA